ncbi:hypothetical protein [Chromobacterium haemolyticum]|uniref:hypothetical protein n=1 Tax=Chromobacterium haemolyticum TaxID=394935 RepID=UPI00244C17EB|nr:hypothetical protein [Chromobacterium haemolyticum]MDH0342066.1 hypothetical protein [Chromobacterium haemolyticum]
MMVRKIKGRLVATGPVMHDGVDNGAEPATIYNYVRLQDENGGDTYMQQVFVPAVLDSLLDVGTAGTFYVVEVAIPKLFGSRPFHFVFGLEVGGKLYQAVPQTRRILNGCKGGAAKLAWYGLILLIAWGFGLLLWVQAARLLSITLPESEMTAVLAGK